MPDDASTSGWKEHPVVRIAIAVNERFRELSGSNTAAGITLSLFLSVFPLILVAVTVLGFIAAGNERFVTDAIKDLGLTGEVEKMFTNIVTAAQRNRGILTGVSLVTGAWSALGVAIALQQAANLPWQAASQGMKDRGKAAAFLCGGGLIVVVSFAVSAAINWLPKWLSPLNYLVGIALGVALFTWLFWYLCTFKLSVRDVLPGAITAAIGFEVLKWLATNWLPNIVARSSAIYGSLGVILGLFAWLTLFGKLLIYASTLNVVLAEDREGVARFTIDVPRTAAQMGVTHTGRGGTVARPKEKMALPWKRDRDGSTASRSG